MESDSKLICRRGRHHVTHTLETRDTLRHSTILRFAYNRHCLNAESNNRFYTELLIESGIDIFPKLECKVGGR